MLLFSAHAKYQDINRRYLVIVPHKETKWQHGWLAYVHLEEWCKIAVMHFKFCRLWKKFACFCKSSSIKSLFYGLCYVNELCMHSSLFFFLLFLTPMQRVLLHHMIILFIGCPGKINAIAKPIVRPYCALYFLCIGIGFLWV